MEELEEIEEDAGLGNGGLGRLAGKCHHEGVMCCLASCQLLRCCPCPCVEEPDRLSRGSARCDPAADVFVFEFAPWFDQFYTKSREGNLNQRDVA